MGESLVKTTNLQLVIKLIDKQEPALYHAKWYICLVPPIFLKNITYE